LVSGQFIATWLDKNIKSTFWTKSIITYSLFLFAKLFKQPELQKNN